MRFSLDAQPAVKGGGNGDAGNYFTTKAPEHQESSGEYCPGYGLALCLGVLVVPLVFAFNAPATDSAFLPVGFSLDAQPWLNGGGHGGGLRLFDRGAGGL